MILYDFTLRYDPSNGLVSIGDIAVFVPGARVKERVLK